ncbi:uncharacterized protein LOC115890658 [Sitophilus oryzae]|uniref:Uncharacterized protein LOC115890658 n=1 Tax=Sitophilus oryzae TaxID=7048 RepID=A0A6J2YUG2_SITOR|nr:uncharacterized protein LOC115890658 [Sitophilus oryzae]
MFDSDIHQKSNNMKKKTLLLKKFCNSSTQTEPRKQIAKDDIDCNTRHTEDMEIPVRNSIIIQPKVATISKLPESYNMFVNKLAEKMKANSTLVLDQPNQSIIKPNDKVEQVISLKRKFVKPGPLCYKKKILNKYNNQESAKDGNSKSGSNVENVLIQKEFTVPGNLGNLIADERFSQNSVINKGDKQTEERRSKETDKKFTRNTSSLHNIKITHLTCSKSSDSRESQHSERNSDSNHAKEQNYQEYLHFEDEKSFIIKADKIYIYNHFYNKQ